MYKTTSRNMQRSMGRDVCWDPNKPSQRRYSRKGVRARWALIIRKTLKERWALPERLPFWLSVEIGAVGLKEWLRRYPRKKPKTRLKHFMAKRKG